MGRPQVILLDTHAAIWFMRNDTALGKKSRAMAVSALEQDQLAVSVISFWEMALLVKKGRLRSLKDPGEQRRRMLSAGVLELPLTGDIALGAVELPNLHGDPADRFIVAPAITHEAMLLTADDALLGWRSKLKRHDAEI
jgi:PIN domain nuclease of toxin-antitoxin system